MLELKCRFGPRTQNINEYKNTSAEPVDKPTTEARTYPIQPPSGEKTKKGAFKGSGMDGPDRTLPLRGGETASRKTKETGKRSAPSQSAERKLAFPEAASPQSRKVGQDSVTWPTARATGGCGDGVDPEEPRGRGPRAHAIFLVKRTVARVRSRPPMHRSASASPARAAGSTSRSMMPRRAWI